MTKQVGELTKKQLAVIDDPVGGEMNETAVLKVLGVSQNQYNEWLKQTDFAGRLQFLLDTTRRDAIRLLANNASKAVECLLQLTKEGNRRHRPPRMPGHPDNATDLNRWRQPGARQSHNLAPYRQSNRRQNPSGNRPGQAKNKIVVPQRYTWTQRRPGTLSHRFLTCSPAGFAML